jgi:hypothetical protein
MRVTHGGSVPRRLLQTVVRSEMAVYNTRMAVGVTVEAGHALDRDASVELPYFGLPIQSRLARYTNLKGSLQ